MSRQKGWQTAVGAVAAAVALPLYLGGITVMVLLMLQDQVGGLRTAALDAAAPAARNAGLLIAALAAAAGVAFIVWLLAWAVREAVNGLRPHDRDNSARGNGRDSGSSVGAAVTTLYAVRSPLGVRCWHAGNEEHAREQHHDSFPDEPIIDVWDAEKPSDQLRTAMVKKNAAETDRTQSSDEPPRDNGRGPGVLTQRHRAAIDAIQARRERRAAASPPTN